MSSSVTTIPVVTVDANQNFTTTAQNVGGFSSVTLLVNRNVGSFSLDSEPTANLSIEIDYSLDGGSTWAFLASADIPGGVLQVTDKQGNVTTYEVSTIQVGFFPGTTHIRGVIRNGAVKVSVSGTLTLS